MKIDPIARAVLATCLTLSAGLAHAQSGPDLKIGKSSSSTFRQGGTATYLLTVANAGDDDTSGPVTLTDPLPAGLTLSSVTSGAGWSCSASAPTLVSCTFSASLPAGQEAPTVSFIVGIALDAPASITNTATVDGGGDVDTGNNSSSLTSSVAPARRPDLTVAKTSTSTFRQGNTATYVLTVSNVGDADTSGTYTLTDPLPAGLILSSVTAPGGWICAASTATLVSCTRSTSIPAGQEAPDVSFIVGVALDAPASITNTVTVEGGGEVDTDNNSSSLTSSVAPRRRPDLTVTKTSSSTLRQGGSATYLLTVANVGDADTSGAYTLTDPMPAGLTLSSVTASGGWSCLASTATLLSCSRSTSIPAGQEAPTVTLIAGVAVDAPASITNTATVEGGGEVETGNNTGSLTLPVTLVPRPDLTVAKTSGSTFVQGGAATYVLTVSNAGSADSSGAVTLTDPMPAGLTVSSVSTSAAWDCTASNADSVRCTHSASIPAGQDAPTVTVNVGIALDAPASVTNTATVAGGGEANAGNNTGSLTSSVAPAPADLTIAKAAQGEPFHRGGSATYQLTVSNVGTGPTVGGVTVEDAMPAGLTATSAAGAGWTCTIAATVVCTRTTPIGAGAASTIVLVAKIAPDAPASITNTATVRNDADSNTANDSGSATISPAAPSADLSITKTDGSATATAGGDVTYTITASNAGPSDAPASRVADAFPAALACTWTCAGGGGGACTASGSGDIDDTASLPIGASVTYTASCAVSAVATGSIANTATVAAAAGVTDPNPGNDAATDTDTVVASADVSIVKTLTTPGPYHAGQAVSYTLLVSNAGPSNATAVRVTDTPTNLAISSVGGGVCAALPCTIPSLAPGASATIAVRATISGAGPFDNAATVSAAEAGGSASDDTDGAGNGGIAAASPAQVPTLSDPALLFVALMLGLAGVWALRPRG